MSLSDTYAFAFSLAASLMVADVVFRSSDGTLSVVPTSEFNGDTADIVHEFNLAA